jgi:hypothetical protein
MVGTEACGSQNIGKQAKSGLAAEPFFVYGVGSPALQAFESVWRV